MAPPGPIVVILIALAVFAAISGVGVVALVWRFLRRRSHSFPSRIIRAAIVVGLLVAYFLLMIAADLANSIWGLVLLSIAVVMGIVVWVIWMIIWLSRSRCD